MNTVLALLGKYLIGLLGIGLVVIIHEYGHLIAARACGIDVEVFSFGLGPKVLGFQHKETEFRLSLLPFGGYCRLKGSDDLSQALLQKDREFTHVEEGSLFSVHPAKRIITYLSGPLLNLIFAILLYAVLASIPYKIITTEPIVATVNDYPSLFQGAQSPAYEQGIRTGDRILSINGEPLADWETLEKELSIREGTILVTLQRGDQTINLPLRGEQSDQGPRYGLSVIRRPQVGSVRPNTPESFAGLQAGDIIVEANGHKVSHDLDLLVALENDMVVTEFLVQRAGTIIPITFRPDLDEKGKGEWNFALQVESIDGERIPFSLTNGWRMTKDMAQETLTSLILLIKGKSRDVRQEFTGTARAALMIGDITTLGLENSTKSGIRALWHLLGIVSISLSIANLLPLPAFDGGQVLTSLYEWILGKRIQPRTYWILQLIGIGVVIGIFLFLGFADILHFLTIRR